MSEPFAPTVVAAARVRLFSQSRMRLRALHVEGEPSPAVRASKVARAVTFMRTHSTTARKAAAVYGVSPQAVCEMHNDKYGTRMMLVGPPVWTGWVWP